NVTNYPNPVSTTTTIAFLSPGGQVAINLLDTQGRFILKITQGRYPAGFHRVVFDRSSLNSGTYFYQVVLNGIAVTKKMLVL
ncbi:MAG TPA: T9SS type A sorting domain-containing protein, partial [Bacteroidetes bacterium]|nr:T9SS type A sorting domain-containing protein [Bacteroidota bacterium]